MRPDDSVRVLARAATRFLFFTGKGGVGKTSVACALAVRLADAGRRVLLVSTDPASNLDDVLGVHLGTQATPLRAVPGLIALNIDPEAEAAAYREKVVGPYRQQLPASVVANMEEQLSGACTTEIAAFDRFSALLGDGAATAQFDHVIFDTAPTGHTLRLLTLPSAWTGFIETNTTGTSCLGPLQGLEKQRALYAAALQALKDRTLTKVILVTRPETAAIREAERTRQELAALGVRNLSLVINAVFHAVDPADSLACALAANGAAAIAALPAGLAALPQVQVPLLAGNVLGFDMLRSFGWDTAAQDSDWTAADVMGVPELSSLIDELAAAGRGVIMTMGKGGVGKTTIAAAIAVALADRGYAVHLSTTDPAAHVAAAVGEAVANLRISRIDPVAETAAYTAQVLATAGAGLAADAHALLEEDLRSPCTEEIAVFQAFARLVAEAGDAFVVLDTAPTGHTLLLLDATEAYHREVTRNAATLPEHVRELLPRLRDPQYTRVLIVTHAEPTPVHEAERLQADLRRADIAPYAWIINRSLSNSHSTDPILRGRAQSEAPFIARIRDELAARVALVPWKNRDPVGSTALRALAGETSRTIAKAAHV